MMELRNGDQDGDGCEWDGMAMGAKLVVEDGSERHGDEGVGMEMEMEMAMMGHEMAIAHTLLV